MTTNIPRPSGLTSFSAPPSGEIPCSTFNIPQFDVNDGTANIANGCWRPRTRGAKFRRYVGAACGHSQMTFAAFGFHKFAQHNRKSNVCRVGRVFADAGPASPRLLGLHENIDRLPGEGDAFGVADHFVCHGLRIRWTIPSPSPQLLTT